MLLGMRNGVGTVPVVKADFTALTAYTTPSWLSFSRGSSGAMMTDSTGKLTWAPSNLLTYSQDFTNAAWFSTNGVNGIVKSNVTMTNPTGVSGSVSLLTFGTASQNWMYQSLTSPANQRLLCSVYLYAGTRRYVQVSFGPVGASNQDNFGIVIDTTTMTIAGTGNGTTGTYYTSSVQNVGNGWYRFSFLGSITSTTGYFVFAGVESGTYSINPTLTTSGGTIYAWGAQIEQVTYQTSPGPYIPTTTPAVYLPRYDYDASTVPATPRGLLIEESRTNQIYYGSVLTSWSASNATITGSSGTAPDGTNTAFLITSTSTADTGIYQVIAFSGVYTHSIYAKKGTGRYLVINTSYPTLGRAWFDLQTGDVVGTTDAGVTATITNVGNGWYRCTASYSSPTRFTCYVTNSTSSTSSTNGDTIYLWGAQSELGAFVTSLIPTTTSASVTRAADVAQLTGSALTVAGAATGSAIVQTTLWENSTAAARDLLSSATTRRLLYSNSSNTVLSSTDGTTGLNATIGGSGTFTGGAVRSAIAWNSAGRSLVASNGTLTSDAVNLSTGATVTIGGYGSTTTFDGWIASLALYNQKLPDAILKQKSQPGGAY